MPFAPHLLSLVVGLLSLGQEILWVRLVSFSQHGAPQAFSFVLATYLVGIALGAHAGKVLTLRSRDLWATTGVVLLLSAAYDLASPWMLGMGSQYVGFHLAGAITIAMSSALKAAIFPIAHHLGTDASGPRVGRSLSRVYVSNIIGCTLGPVVFGFWLLDRFSTQQCFALLEVLFSCTRMVI